MYLKYVHARGEKMKVAIVGSRSLINVEISKYIPENVTEIISGGAVGIDTLAEKVADERRISKSIIRPEYDKYGKKAPLIRNKEIVERAELVIAFWDGKSRGTKFTIDYAKKLNKKIKVYVKGGTSWNFLILEVKIKMKNQK